MYSNTHERVCKDYKRVYQHSEAFRKQNTLKVTIRFFTREKFSVHSLFISFDFLAHYQTANADHSQFSISFMASLVLGHLASQQKVIPASTLAVLLLIASFLALVVQGNPAFSGTSSNSADEMSSSFVVADGVVEFPENATPEAWNKLLRTYEFLFVNFYADWCRFSRALEPNWRMAAHKVSNFLFLQPYTSAYRDSWIVITNYQSDH
jgi:hypothetical protein